MKVSRVYCLHGCSPKLVEPIFALRIHHSKMSGMPSFIAVFTLSSNFHSNLLCGHMFQRGST